MKTQGSFQAGGMYWYVGAILVVSAVLGVGRGEFGVAALSLIAGLGVLALPVIRWKQELEIDAEGFTWTQLTGVKRVKADEVKKVTLVHRRTRMGHQEEVQVELAGGKELVIVGVEQAEQAANLIHDFTVRA